jgi:hypothetical protein
METVETPKAAKTWVANNYGTYWEEGRPDDNAQWGVCIPVDGNGEPIFGYGLTLIDAVNSAIEQQ